MCVNATQNKFPLINNTIIEDILINKSYWAEYQPIISPYTSVIHGYEALSRFMYEYTNIPPKIVFDYCHKNLKMFYELEMATKRYQFENRPTKGILFVNFDPHIFYEKSHVNDVFESFSHHKEFVIELVENSHRSVKIELLVEIFRKFEFQFAVDDFFQDNTMLSIFLLNNCDYLKLDMGILEEIKKNQNFTLLVEGIIKFAHSENKYVILEGIETIEDVELAKNLKVDFVQGFYYENQFIRQ